MRRWMPLAGLLLPIVGCEVNESPDVEAQCSTIADVYSVTEDVQVTASIIGRTPGSVPETFLWEIVQQPAETSISMLFPELRDSAFTPPVEGTYVAQVTITDFDGSVAPPCQVTVEVNPAPVACFDGSMSNDWPDLMCPPEPILVFISGETAIEAAGGAPSATSYTAADGSAGDAGITLNFLSAAGDDICAMTVTPAEGADLREAAWSQSSDDIIFGYSFGDAPVIGGDCAGAGLNPAVVTDDVEAFIGGLDLGFAVTVPDPELYDAYEEFIVGNAGQAVWTNEWEPFVNGAGLYVGELADSPLGALQNDNLVVHHALNDALVVEYTDVDESGDFTEDDTLNTLPALSDAGPVQTGAYEIRSGFVFDVRCILSPELCVVEEE